jgi:hypothetical protein
VRYASSRFLRLLKGTGTYLAGTPLLGRLAHGAPDLTEFAPLAGFGAAALVGWLAYRLRSGTLGVCAVLAAGAAFPVVLLVALAFAGMPFLFWSWRRNRGVRGAFLFFGAMAATAAIVAWRVPHPTPAPTGAVREATAVVRKVRLVGEIWTDADEQPGRSRSGQPIGRPFQMLDLEFTPEGATEPIHVMDRIDLGSVPSIEKGGRVPIVYQASDPAIAHVAGATRSFPRHALAYLLALTYGFGGVVTFLLIPAARALERRVRRSVFGTILTQVESARRSTRRPPGSRP